MMDEGGRMKPQTMIEENEPYALSNPEEVARRLKLIQLPHIKPLIQLTDKMRRELGAGYSTPFFDPLDGGILARVLLLLEAPGPKAVASTFVSRNNPDQSAKNMCVSLAKAGIAREDTLLWNIVPWYIGTGTKIRPARKSDILQAMPYTKELLAQLPRLEAIVLVGRKAQLALTEIQAISPVRIFTTYHTSPLVFNNSKEKRAQVESDLATVGQYLAAKD